MTDHIFETAYAIFAPRKVVQEEDTSDWCYLLYDPDSRLYKIGITINPYKRLSSIRHASGRVNLTLVFAIQMQAGVDEAAWMVEKSTKKFFKPCRVVGEWYRLTPRHLVILRGLVNYLGGEDIIDNTNIKRIPSKSTRKALENS